MMRRSKKIVWAYSFFLDPSAQLQKSIRKEKLQKIVENNSKQIIRKEKYQKSYNRNDNNIIH